MPKYDAFDILAIEDSSFWPEGFDALGQALREFDTRDIPKLQKLLRSDCCCVSARGLYLFGELGARAYAVLDDALCLTHHPNARSRTYIVAGILSYSDKLSVKQIAHVFSLPELNRDVNPSEFVTIFCLIVLIGVLHPQLLESAHLKLSNKCLRKCHIEAFKWGKSRAIKAIDNMEVDRMLTNVVVDLKASRLPTVYSLACLLRATYEDKLKYVPICHNDNFIGQSVAANIEMVLGRKLRKKDPDILRAQYPARRMTHQNRL